MTILGKGNRTGHVRRHIRSNDAACFASSTSAGMPRRRASSAIAASSSSACPVLQSINSPRFTRAEIVVGQFRQFLKAGAAGEIQVAQQRRGVTNVLRVGRPPEIEPPAQQVPIQPRLDLEGRFGVPHPFQSQRDHAGRGEWHEMARHNHSRVAERAVIPLLRIAVEHRASNPGFDVTPAERITGIVTPAGIFKPKELWANRCKLGYRE